MKHQVVLATNNGAKLAELKRIVAEAELDLEVLGLADLPRYAEPLETANSFQGNALIKARAALYHTGFPALADDSGLAVDVLNQMPGVRSSRWAGPDCDDEANLQLVLDQIDDVPDDQRQARFICAVALVMPNGREHVVVDAMEGHLIREKRGQNGFGYDPIFVPEGFNITSAEMSSEQKDAISHRGKALRQMLPYLVGWLGLDNPQLGMPDYTEGTDPSPWSGMRQS